eukprot:3937876-Rhodomonas_salina.2
MHPLRIPQNFPHLTHRPSISKAVRGNLQLGERLTVATSFCFAGSVSLWTSIAKSSIFAVFSCFSPFYLDRVSCIDLVLATASAFYFSCDGALSNRCCPAWGGRLAWQHKSGDSSGYWMSP